MPKRIAGVKVPKSLRRSALADLAATPGLGRDLLAGALLAAAAAAAAALARHRGEPAERTAADDGADAVPAPESGTDVAAETATSAEASRAAADRTADYDEDRIRQRAHAIWEREGRPVGRDAEHWRQARREIEGEAPPS